MVTEMEQRKDIQANADFDTSSRVSNGYVSLYFSFVRDDVLLKIINLLFAKILTYVKITTWSSSPRRQYSIPKS